MDGWLFFVPSISAMGVMCRVFQHSRRTMPIGLVSGTQNLLELCLWPSGSLATSESPAAGRQSGVRQRRPGTDECRRNIVYSVRMLQNFTSSNLLSITCFASFVSPRPMPGMSFTGLAAGQHARDLYVHPHLTQDVQAPNSSPEAALIREQNAN